eukprot:TRINITY_DN2391_c0_g1_i1.p1 TRINITY_DN2391_c0_g1~~TRINITY_DN2391_c0_g1_i1.p1  ORF type:complete len:183 (+),score=32.49 TRINITY_DN2391_c0_g1_i1:70-618(+)
MAPWVITPAAFIAWLFFVLWLLILVGVLGETPTPAARRLIENRLLDFRPFWDEGQVTEYFEIIGPEGRERYVSFLTSILGDCSLAISFGLAFLFSLYVLQPNNRWLCSLPVVACCCDLLENICVYRLLTSYPTSDSFAYMFGPKATFIKFACIIVAVPCILCPLVVSLTGMEPKKPHKSKRL